MAKMVQDKVVITVSKIARNSDDDTNKLVSNEIRAAIEQVVAELVGSGLIVEIEE